MGTMVDEKRIFEPSKVNMDDKYKGGLEVLDWAYKTYGEEIVYACSFGAEGSVLIDLISKVQPDAKIVFLDTQFHFKETYALIEEVKNQYPTLAIDMKKPELSPEEQAKEYGKALWERDPNHCCYLRKIKPLENALKGKKAWISGLRREQSPTRQHVQFVSEDQRFGLTKICPLIYWTWEDVWDYIRTNDLPYHALHDKGYPSIGCEQCTLPASDPNDLRSGRWADSMKTECGLHQPTVTEKES